ncbi:hypothetical protein L0244_37250 [bacterium]|nr:hypothetical protein [bacterium]
MNVRKLFFCTLILVLLIPEHSKAKEALTLENRIEAQKKIEEVYYRHRIWPNEGISPKPDFNEKISDRLIQTKVLDSLKKSAALEKFWNRKISAEMLQAEIDRMARTTKDASTLRELFSALDNNAFLIAETLGRQTLADRLIRNWYAFDQRFHNSKKAKALSIFKNSNHESWTQFPGYSKVRIELDSAQTASPKPGTLNLTKDEFEKIKKRYPKLEKLISRKIQMAMS